MADDQIQPERPERRAEDEFQDEPPARRRPRLRADEDDLERIRQPDAVNTIIPYKNPSALLAYYLGVFSLIPCVGLVLGPGAFALGFVGLNYKKKHPTAGGTAHAIIGIVLGTLVTLAHLGMILLMTLGAVFGSR